VSKEVDTYKIFRELEARKKRANPYKFYDKDELIDEILKDEEEIERLNNIIKEAKEILKFHLSNPSGTKNGWHIDIWNSEDINKLNEYLGILDKGKE